MKGGGGGGRSGESNTPESGPGKPGTEFNREEIPTLSDVKGFDAVVFGAGGGSGKSYNDYMLFKST